MNLVQRAIVIGALIAVTSAAIADRPNLQGNVVNEQGKAIEGAIVAIYSAGPRVGTSPYCPTCYVDCAKRKKTNSGGGFEISSLDPSLVFRIYAMADGYTPRFVEKVDPVEGPVKITLSALDPEWLKPGHVIDGRIVDASDVPVVGAEVEPFGMMKLGERRWWGRVRDVSQLAVSDDKGRFRFVSKHKDYMIDLRVEGRGYAPKLFHLVAAGELIHEFRLEQGAFVSGTLFHEGKPLPGVELGVVQSNRDVEVFLGEKRIGTNKDGNFLFSNIGVGYEYLVYTKMDSMQSVNGVPCLPIQVVEVGDDLEGKTLKLNKLETASACRLKGRVVLTDGKPVPQGTRVAFSREKPWDSQRIELDANGRFDVMGVPKEVISIFLRIPGYRLSENNPALDPVRGGRSLIGSVTGNTDDFLIELEPAEGSPSTVQDWEELERIKQLPLRGAPFTAKEE